MKKKPIITKLLQELIQTVSSVSSLKQYKNKADIIYKGHIPHSGFLLVDGRITLKSSRDKSFDIFNGSLIGVRELMNAEPFNFDAQIESNSSVYILDKSTVNEILFGENPLLKEVFQLEIML